jgi:hypothetical protein
MSLKKIITICLAGVLGFSVGFFAPKMRTKKSDSFASLTSGIRHLQSAIVEPVYASTTPTASTSVRAGFFLIGGYPSHATWEAINPDHATEGAPPETGLLGVMGSIIDGMAQIAVANGVTSCDAIPSTGSYTGTISIPLSTAVSVEGTLSFATPTHSIPASWTSGGTAFTKRIKFSSTNYTVAIEFICSRAAGWAAMSIPGDSISGSTRTLNLYLDTQSADAYKFEMAMKVEHSSCPSSSCDSQLLRAETGASNQFSLWSSSYAYRSSVYQTERILMNGNTSSGAFSTYYAFNNSAGADQTALTGTDDGTTSTSDVDFQQTTTSPFAVTGCYDVDTPTTNPASTSDCTSYALSSPSATVYTASGSPGFSVNGLKALYSLVEAP